MNIRSAQEQSIADTVVNQVETQVLRALRETEDKLDEELRQLEQVSDDDLERLRERRLRELKAEAREREELLELGHGTYVEIDEKDFFSAAKRSRYMVTLVALTCCSTVIRALRCYCRLSISTGQRRVVARLLTATFKL